MKHLPFLFALLGSCLMDFAGAAQQLPPDLLADETFQRPMPSYYWLGQTSDLVGELTPAGYVLRFIGASGLNYQALNPPGPPINQDHDFVIEGELRGQGGEVGLYWGGGRNASGGYNFTVVQLTLSAASPTINVLRLQGGVWTTLASNPLPAATAADWHTIRIARSGATLSYWLDGTRLLEQPWAAPGGLSVGLTVQKTGATVTLRRLRIWHHHTLRLAPGVPASLRRERLGTPGLNTGRNESTPMVSADGRYLYFSRAMGDPKAVDNAAGFDSDIFVAERGADGQWGQVLALGPPINTATSNFPVYVAPDGQTLLMTGRYAPNGEVTGPGLSRTQRQADGTWTIPQPQPEGTGTRSDFGVRNSTYCLDASGTVLLRSAVLETDLNNTDLYLCRRRPDGTWTSPMLLPAPLNTAGNETSPFLAPDGKTLYFASDTHPGYGSYDVFVSTRLDDSWTRWSEPLNLGPAVNSILGDLYYTTGAAGDYAYLVSYDSTGNNSDIYRLVLPPALRPAPTLLVRGRVLDARTSQPIANAEVRYEQLPTGTETGVVLPAVAGSFEAVLPAGQLYGLRATAPGYLSVNENLDLTAEPAYRELRQDLLLLPLLPPTETLAAAAVKLQAGAAPALPTAVTGVAAPKSAEGKEEKFALNNVFFVQGKPVLLPGSYPELIRLAQTLQENPTLRIRLDGHTDNTSDAKDPKPNQTLSEQRVAAIKAYLTKRGVAEGRLQTQGFGGARPVAPNDTEEHKRQNRRVEFVIINR